MRHNKVLTFVAVAMAICWVIPLSEKVYARYADDSTSEMKLDFNSVNITALEYGIGKWTKAGYARIDLSSKVNPVVYLFSKAGQPLGYRTLSIPGAERVEAHDFDVSPDGTVIISGLSYSDSGQQAAFIARIPSNQGPTQVIRTTPYWPFMVSAASDGSIWTVGVEELYGNDGHITGNRQDGNVLRHFAVSGELLTSLVPKSRVKLTRLTTGFLVATDSKLGWYSPPRSGRYTEVDLKTSAIHAFEGIPNELVSGFALTSDGVPYVTYKSSDQSGFKCARFDESATQWISVKGFAQLGATFPELKGNEGELLVLSGNDKSLLKFVVPPSL
jgi:hypothetical protein